MFNCEVYLEELEAPAQQAALLVGKLSQVSKSCMIGPDFGTMAIEVTPKILSRPDQSQLFSLGLNNFAQWYLAARVDQWPFKPILDLLQYDRNGYLGCICG
jgi:hypothetical protein